jgi:uncharacterized membrane protein
MANPRLTSIRNAFLTGLLLLAPLVVTIWAVLQIIAIVGGNFRPLFAVLIPIRFQDIPLIWELAATIVVFSLITLFGFISHYFFGKYLLDLGERVILGIPGLSTVQPRRACAVSARRCLDDRFSHQQNAGRGPGARRT